MKKLLLCSAAVAGLTLGGASAQAQIDVTVGGHTKNYLGWLDQDTATGQNDARSFDMLRESEIHFNAEGIADNGLTYGFHVELKADGGDGVGDNKTIDESYLYLSGGWGRVNLGSEDGANYLLQVAAPSADSNIDGIRQYVQPVNYTLAGLAAAGTVVTDDGLDYDNDLSGKAEKVTYLSPVWSGFQFGLSYTPDVEDDGSAQSRIGFNEDDQDDKLGSAYEGALRYEGQFDQFGFAVGAGYTAVDVENEVGGNDDDATEWNVGGDVDVGPFGFGVIYTQSEDGVDAKDTENKTIVGGVDYTTGAFKFGASYLNGSYDAGTGGTDIDTDRYTGGVIYSAAPGLSFRGSISYVDHDVDGGDDIQATSVLGGVQLNF